MDIMTFLFQLLEKSIHVDTAFYVPYKQVKEGLEVLRRQTIQWDVEDFRSMAYWQKGNDWETFYDESRFEQALHTMIEKHDPEVGICWNTVRYYLDLLCTRPAVEVQEAEPAIL